MNEKVQAYLEAKRAEQAANEERKSVSQDRERALYRRRVLIKAGLFYKEYTDLKYKTDQYPNYDAQVGKYFAAVTYPVTDEEFEEIERYTPIDENPQTEVIKKPARITSLAQVTRPNELAIKLEGWAGNVEAIRALIIGLGILLIIVGVMVAGSVDGDLGTIIGVLLGVLIVPSLVIYGIILRFFARMMEALSAIVENTRISADAAVYAHWKEENKE